MKNMDQSTSAKTRFMRILKRYRPESMSGRNMALSLTSAYILALGIIATLTIASHVLTDQINNKQREGASLTYMIGRQRSLAQQAVINATIYFQSGDKLQYDFLSQSINDLESGHKSLVGAIAKKDYLGAVPSDVLYKIYFESNSFSAKNVDEFIQAARRFMVLPVEGKEEERGRLINALSGELSRRLIVMFDVALEDHQEELLKKIDKAYVFQSWSAFFILFVLVVEAVFIFSPLVKRIREYQQMLLREALEDHLTGLYNRRAFMKRAVVELGRSRREKNPVTVVLADLDHFKSVNDRYGHKVGDIVLRRFADMARESFRSGDVVGRVGGEEFAILLPNTGSERGFQIIERFRKRVCETPCNYVDEDGEQKSLSFTASFGLVVMTGDGWTVDQLLAAADEKLYAAKAAGRNCVMAGVLQGKESPEIQAAPPAAALESAAGDAN